MKGLLIRCIIRLRSGLMSRLDKEIRRIRDNPSANLEYEKILARERLQEKNQEITDESIEEEIIAYRKVTARKGAIARIHTKQRKKRNRMIASVAAAVFVVFLATPTGWGLAERTWNYIVTFGDNAITHQGVEGFEPEYTFEAKETKTFVNIKDASEYIGGIPLYYFDGDEFILEEVHIIATGDRYMITSFYLNSNGSYITVHESIYKNSKDIENTLDELSGDILEEQTKDGLQLYIGNQAEGSYATGVNNNVLVQIFGDELEKVDLAKWAKQLKE